MNKITPLDSSVALRSAKTPEKIPATQDPKGAAQQFEAMMLQQLMQSMWNTVPKGELLSGSNEEGYYRDMLNEAISTSIAEGRGIGIKEVILRDISKLEKKK
jgi:Rod binding domain-containing protein